MQFIFEKICVIAENDVEVKASGYFINELNKRNVSIADNSQDALNIVFMQDENSFENNDCYNIIFKNNTLTFSAKTIRGLIFAYSHFLRKCEFKNNKIILTKDISGTHTPKKAIRGHQIGYRTTPNTYDAWDYNQYFDYYLDMMAFTTNTCEHMPYEKGVSKRNCLMKYDEEEFLIEASHLADTVDLDVSIWHPNSDDESIEVATEKRRELYKKVPRIDYLFIPGGDPGEYYADEFIERTKRFSEVLKEHHKNAKVYPSAQAPHKYRDWGDKLIEELEKEPTEIDGLIMGPNHAFPMHELRAKTPKKYPMRFYPDITHNVRCEYPVHFLNDDWHYAFASTLSRESVNPRPVEFSTLHRLFSHYTVGSVSYSEGVHDDLNKMVWSLLEFDDTYPLRDAVSDYVRYFFYSTDTEYLTEAIFALEKNWEGNPLNNPSINSTYRAFCELKHDYPALSTNWRFLLLYFRACCDKLVLERMKFENALIEDAKYYLKNFDIQKAKEILNTAYPESYNNLRTEIFQLGEELFNLIGIQLDVEHYHTDSWERGATLDTIDRPVTDRLWLLNRLDYCESLPESEQSSFITRLLNRNSVASDEYYYSVALHELVALGVKQDGEFYMNFQGDRPENDGRMPMSMLKVYDHFSFRAKLGGFRDRDYTLTVIYKDHSTKDTHQKITANGHIVYEGISFGGERNEQFDKEMLCEGFLSISYKINKEIFVNGTLDLLITEETKGIEICEFFIK